MDDNDRLTVTISGEDRAPVVLLAGEIDASTTVHLNQLLDPYLRQPDLERITFSMSEVTFLDSSGLSAIIRASNCAPNTLVRNPSDAALLVLRATGLDDVLHIEP